MTLKDVGKFKRKLTYGLKKDIRSLVNFHASTWKSENLHFDWIHFSKAYKYLDEKVQKSSVSWQLESDAKFEKILTLGSKNDMRNLVNFNASSGRSGNLHFDVLLLPIAHKASA